MVEVAKEVVKPDYLSLVNQSGSGFNVSELVDAIVGSEIEPKRYLQRTKQEKTENAISGIGFLTSQASSTQSSFTSLKSDTFFEINSSNTSGVTLKSTDETKLQPGNRNISSVTMAKKMAFEFGGFSNLTDKFTANLTIDLGAWTKTAASSSDATNSFASQKTYIVTSEITDNADVTEITGKTADTVGNPIAVGTTFTVTDGQSGNISSAFLKEIDTYAFQDADVANSDILNFADKSVSEVAALLNDIDGISATTVDTTGEGTNYSIIVTSDETGADNGFRITGDNSRFVTPTLPDASTTTNKFSQLASDATFTLDGVQVTRESNSITDLIDGATIEIKSDFDTSASIGVSRSETNVLSTVNSVINSLNNSLILLSISFIFLCCVVNISSSCSSSFDMIIYSSLILTNEDFTSLILLLTSNLSIFSFNNFFLFCKIVFCLFKFIYFVSTIFKKYPLFLHSSDNIPSLFDFVTSVSPVIPHTGFLS